MSQEEGAMMTLPPDVAAAKAATAAQDSEAAKLETVLSTDRPPLPTPTPTSTPVNAEHGGHILTNMPAASRGSDVAAGKAMEKAAEEAERRLDAALQIERGPPATPDVQPLATTREAGPTRNLFSDRHAIGNHYKQIDEKLSQYPFLNDLEKFTHVPKTILAAALLGLSSFSLVTGVAVRPLTTFFTLFYPTIATIKLASQPDSEEWKKLAVYFVCASWVNFVDFFFGPVMLAILPSWNAFKILLFGWLGAVPGYSGALVVYKNLFPQRA